jgi:maltose alpha-D-glucosyltransferase / alpha-amylase
MDSKDQSLWYKDAIIYQLHVLSFYDSNSDGIGDFNGLIQKLDYIKELGVDAVWLLPFYPSPLKDGGYDISDFMDIHPSYGTLGDFKKFIKEAHIRGLRVITELVLNHTSSQHRWFQRARNSKEGSKYRDYYVWNDSPDKYNDARIIFQDFESSNWSWDPVARAYYWHRFYSHQPDLNFDNENVHKSLFKIIDFWFETGIDGLRLDAVPYLYERDGTNCENLPETHKFLKKLRAYIDARYENKMLLAEANQWPEDSSAYFGSGDECHMAFNFPLMPRLYMSMKMEDRFPIIDIMDQMPVIPENCQWAIFLRNHDELTLEMVTDEERDYMYKSFARDPKQRINLGIRRRLAPLLDNDRRKIEMSNMLLFSLPGTPIVYYGDEIGMGDNHYLGDRDGVRTPMQWSSNKNSGFSTCDPQRMFLPVIINYDYHYEAVNVENQERNPTSILWWMRRVIAKRKQYKAFSRGGIRFLDTGNPRVLAFIREFEEEKILVIINLSRYSQVARINLSGYAGYLPVEVFSRNEFPVIENNDYVFPLQFKDYFWFELVKPEQNHLDENEGLNQTISFTRSDWNKMSVKTDAGFNKILLRYIRRNRWFRRKSGKIRSLEIGDFFCVQNEELHSYILIINLSYIENKTETYVLPISIAEKEEAARINSEYPMAILSSVKFSDTDAILYDAAFDTVMHEKILEMVVSGTRLKNKAGTITGKPGKFLTRMIKKKELPLESSVLVKEQLNTSILFGNRLIFKIYRSPQEGKNPEIDILRYLTEKSTFRQIPVYGGSIDYTVNQESVSVGMLSGYVPNEGNAWELTQSFLGQYFDKLQLSRDEIPQVPLELPTLFQKYTPAESEMLSGFADHFFLEMVSLLGRRTAEMHMALSSEKNEKDFMAEPFSLLYQKSIYQSFRTLIKRTFTDLRARRNTIPLDYQDLLKKILDSENLLLERIKSVLENGKIRSLKTRIHGDYRLKQVLFTGKDFIIIDFEGEQDLDLSARILKYCPFKDLAGMIRSFHYAAYSGLSIRENMYPDIYQVLEPWIEHWYQIVTKQFLNGYLVAAENALFIPAEQDQIEDLINLFLIEKAVLETDRELNNRPERIGIPVKGLERIIKDFLRP